MNTTKLQRSYTFIPQFLIALIAAICFIGIASHVIAAPIRVVVWDERQDAQKQAYTNHLGDTLAKELETHREFKVKSVGLNDPDQGLTDEILDNCDVLIWWGHQKHAQVTPEHVKAVVDRVKAGKISLIALHSAHWSKPFIGCMNERAIEDALKSIPESERDKVKVVTIPWRGGMSKPDETYISASRRYKADDGTDTLEVKLPGCIFAVVKNAGLPSHITTVDRHHPIAKGIPAHFDVPQTEMYAGPFNVPKPDALIFEEKWDDGQSFTSGCAWTVGKGRVFYFRPGHETYPIYLEKYPLQVVVNAIKWANKK